jgi:hypothetical protein
MTWKELACRTRQRADRWWDAVTPAFGPAGEPRRGWRRQPPLPAAEPRALFLETAPHRFFAGAADVSWLAPHAGTRTGWAGELVERATAIVEGRFDLLGYQQLEFGQPIDWHWDPVSGGRAPLVHWSRIDALDAAAIGDSKVIWELNRHQWMVTLAEAYRLTGNERFAEVALARLDVWVAANPYPRGVNWASSLEVSFRLIAWCWTLMLLRDAAALGPERFDRWQTLMRAHARHIERFLSHYYSPNTHLTGEALGLVYAGLVFAGSRDAARWRDVGRRILVDELARQVLPDGVHFERATCYHRYTADIYLHLLILAARNRLPMPAEVPTAVHRIVRSLLTLVQPDHMLPNIGDADGGWLLPLTSRDPCDPRATFGVAAVLFDDPDCAWAAGEWTPDVSWLLGGDAEARFRSIEPRPPALPPSTLLPHGGYAVMRSDWSETAHQMIVNVGPLGCPVSGAHGHADLLSVQCSAFGEPFIVDPGTFCYTADAAWRAHFRGTAAHSTVVIVGRPHAEPAGPFAWRARPAARLSSWESTAGYDLVDATHDAYERSSSPVSHRRRVLFLKPNAWVIVDDLTGAGHHASDLRFQFSPRIVTIAAGGCVRAEGTGERSLWLWPVSSQALAMSVREGAVDPIDGWVSTEYGMRNPAPALVIRLAPWTDAVRIVTVIVAVAEPGGDPPAVAVTRDRAGVVTGVRIAQDPRAVQFDHASLWIEPSVDRQRSA